MGRKHETTSLGEVVAHVPENSGRERALADAYYKLEGETRVHSHEYVQSQAT